MEEFKARLLKFSLEHLGLSQSAFEDSCGIAHGTISSIKVKGPSVDVLAKISSAYPELDMNWLVSGRGKMLIRPQEDHPAPPSPSVSIGSVQTINIGNWSELVELLKGDAK